MDEAELLQLINGGKPGSGSGTGNKPGSMPGRGGVNRGPGTAPITLADEESNLGTKNLEAVNSNDLSRAAPADLIGITQTEHDLDQSNRGAQAGGNIGSAGSGGETVWKDSLLPAEKAVLKKYFE